MPLPPLIAWQTLGLRATAFRVPPSRLEEPTWWVDLVGSPPDKVTLQPKIGLLQQEGPFGGGNLSLQVQLDRIDWNLAPKIDPSEELLEPPSLGSFPDATNVFAKLAIQWLAVCPPVTRLAFGAAVFQPAADRVAGYRQVKEYLPDITLDPVGASDFLYQINRPRASAAGVAGLQINRLTKWSVMAFGSFRVVVTPGQLTSFAEDTQRYACRLDLDINTVPYPDGRELTHVALASIFGELIVLAHEIASNGDIP